MHPPPDRRHRPSADRPTAAHPSQVILHSFVPSRLFGAASSLRALISPLEYRGVFIPLLPAGLMPDADARTLLFDCSTPYLIGVESALLAQLGGAPASTVVFSIDDGTVRHAPGTGWYSPHAPPVLGLCRELQARAALLCHW